MLLNNICPPHCTYVSLHCYCSQNIDPTLLQTSIKTGTLIDHTTAIYVIATNMPLKYHIYATCPNNLTCIYGGSMPIHMPHRKLLPSMMYQKWLTKMTLDNDDVHNNDSTTTQLYSLS